VLALTVSSALAAGYGSSRSVQTEILELSTQPTSRHLAARVADTFRSRAELLKQLVYSGDDADLQAAFELSAGLGPTLRTWAKATLSPENSTEYLEQRKQRARDHATLLQTL
jgi:hypothetical protein